MSERRGAAGRTVLPAFDPGLGRREHAQGGIGQGRVVQALVQRHPQAARLDHPAEGLRTPPANILFIDDRPENIEAALAVGMQAIQYTTHNAFEQEMCSRNLDSLLQLDGQSLEGNPVSQNGNP